MNRNYYEDRGVLDDVSFKVDKGEAIGIVGRNGCGKSTLLKLLTKIMYPDKGSIQVVGRIASLIELGAGFHPDMSGRENIYTNASIFGLSRHEIDEKLQKIIEFSELGEFIDNPVRTYSSGMYMRLAFSVAIHVDADVLLIDEILAVGDASFQAKCFNKLREIKANGVTIVIVSHSLAQIEQICDRSLWIKDGKIQIDGPPRDVHPVYLEYMGENSEYIYLEDPDIPQTEWVRSGSGQVRVTSVDFFNENHEERSRFKTGSKLIIEIGYKVLAEIPKPNIGVAFFRNDNVYCYGVNLGIDNIMDYSLKDKGMIRFTINENNLLPGSYYLDITIQTMDGSNYDYCRNVKSFEMYSEINDTGIVRLKHSWNIN